MGMQLLRLEDREESRQLLEKMGGANNLAKVGKNDSGARTSKVASQERKERPNGFLKED